MGRLASREDVFTEGEDRRNNSAIYQILAMSGYRGKVSRGNSTNKLSHSNYSKNARKSTFDEDDEGSNLTSKLSPNNQE